MTEPVREKIRLYRCRCCLMHELDAEPPDGRCGAEVGPDEPFCKECEDRHRNLVMPDTSWVSAWTGPDDAEGNALRKDGERIV